MSKDIKILSYEDVYPKIIKLLGLEDNIAGEILTIELDPTCFVKVIRKGMVRK